MAAKAERSILWPGKINSIKGSHANLKKAESTIAPARPINTDAYSNLFGLKRRFS